MSLERFRKRVFEDIASAGAGFDEPDDDWTPALFLENKTGRMTAIGLDGRLFNGAERKDVVAQLVLPVLAAMIGAIRAALVMPAWMSAVAPDDEERAAALAAGELTPSRDPLAVEALTVMIVTADQIELWTARILRSLEEPPRLGDWKQGEDAHWPIHWAASGGTAPELRGKRAREPSPPPAVGVG